jgi:hypothetical protein
VRRTLGRVDARQRARIGFGLSLAGLVVILLNAVGVWHGRVADVIADVFGVWAAVSLLAWAWKTRKRRRSRDPS